MFEQIKCGCLVPKLKNNTSRSKPRQKKGQRKTEREGQWYLVWKESKGVPFTPFLSLAYS